MRPTLHIPDGFLAPEVSIALWVVTAAVIAVALRRISTDLNKAPARTVLMGIAGAFIFAAQMFNFPVAAGTSGHLLGGVLAGVLLGPWAGSIVMATVIGIQALLFQDGGLLVLGANIFNMGVIGTLGGSLIARATSEVLGGGRKGQFVGVGFAA
ncbi:MAG: energy-coupling factor ABC transporter permease, partial [Candidatus Limnocylindrus sp.]